MGLFAHYVEIARGKVQSHGLSEIVQLLLLLESFRRGCRPTEENK